MRHGSSPRTWGCFHESEGERRELGVFPTHVGVFPMIRSGFPPEVCLPHARGGVSYELLSDGTLTVSSPRTWGCFRQAKKSNRCCFVFPTHVGVFPVKTVSMPDHVCLPHARGGVSRGKPEPDPHPASSPRTWGCFSWWRNDTVSAAVFPTHVGVFLS